MYSAATAIKFVTDGMLVRETMQDPLLSKYSVVMVRACHPRFVARQHLEFNGGLALAHKYN
jgi:HrpA-like RNA helicase